MNDNKADAKNSHVVCKKGGVKRLIVAADDFGLTRSVNEGIEQACREGIVTFINFIPTGEAFDDAARRAHQLQLKEAGAHLSLSETVPVLNASQVPTLVGHDGRFHRHYSDMLLRFFAGLVDRDQIYLELRAQLDKVKALGIPILNLSSHEHIHMIPAILEIFIRLAKEYRIPSIRYPRPEKNSRALNIGRLYRSIILGYFGKKTLPVLKSSGLAYTDHFMGLLDSGRLDEQTLMRIVPGVEEGSTELVCHPGFIGPEVLDRYTFHRNAEAELFALTSPRVRKLLEENQIKLATYKEILSGA